jgi:hypothetical protein
MGGLIFLGLIGAVIFFAISVYNALVTLTQPFQKCLRANRCAVAASV